MGADGDEQAKGSPSSTESRCQGTAVSAPDACDWDTRSSAFHFPVPAKRQYNMHAFHA